MDTAQHSPSQIVATWLEAQRVAVAALAPNLVTYGVLPDLGQASQRKQSCITVSNIEGNLTGRAHKTGTNLQHHGLQLMARGHSVAVCHQVLHWAIARLKVPSQKQPITINIDGVFYRLCTVGLYGTLADVGLDSKNGYFLASQDVRATIQKV